MRILYLPHQFSQQRQHEKARWIYPVLLAMQAEWYRRQGHDVVWDDDSKYMLTIPNDFPLNRIWRGGFDEIRREPENIDFLKLPPPDRVFTKAFTKKYQNNGNFKYHPGTYMQVANGCWWGKCEFCVEKKNVWKVRPVESVMEELEEINRLGFKEVFDDSGTFPVGDWLEQFIRNIHRSKLGCRLGCNMRMVDAPYGDMRMAGFRMLLFGLESANPKTLDIINKGTKVEDIKYIIKAAKAGLDCHLAVMFGFPWETDKDAETTLRTVHYLLKKGYAKTAQASFYQNPPRVSNERHRPYVRRIYDVAKSPTFWINKLRDIHDVDDIKYLWRQIKEGLWNRTR